MTGVVVRRVAALAAAVLGALALAIAASDVTSRHAVGDGSWRPAFAQSHGLVANELDVTSAADRVARSTDWIVTSGSLFSDSGAGWTGDIDGRTPDPRSRTSTGSAVFRVVSHPHFLSCSVAFDLRLDSMTTTTRTQAQDYDGVHVFLRYQDPWNLYVVSVARRDGQVVVKRKQSSSATGGDDEADYVTLATAVGSFPLHTWRHVVVAVDDARSGPRLTLSVDGRTLLDVVDEGVGAGGPLREAGRIGLRGDNTEFHFRDVRVTPLT